MQGNGGWSRYSNPAPDAGGGWRGELLQAGIHGRGNGSVRITGGIGRRRRLTKLAKVSDGKGESGAFPQTVRSSIGRPYAVRGCNRVNSREHSITDTESSVSQGAFH